MILPFLVLLPVLAGFALTMASAERRGELAAAAGLVLAAVVLLAALAIARDERFVVFWTETLRISASLTPLSATVLLIVPLVALPVAVFAALLEDQAGLSRLVGLLVVFVGGMELVVIADDLLTLLIGWEVIGATSWALIAHHWRQSGNVASGAWAFVVTRVGDLGLFLAVMALFGATGSFAIDGIATLTGWPLAVVAGGLLVCAAAKAGQVPFSPWLFRAMDAPSTVSALLHAATMVAAGAYLVARVEPYLGEAAWFGDAAVAIGLVTALAGGTVAILQNHVKRLLAASTSAQLGFMFMAAGAGYPAVAILHLVAHAAYKAPLFLAAGTAGDVRGTYALHRLRLGRARPLLTIAVLFPALALAGVPPLGGAWTKEEVVAAVGHVAFPLALLAILAGGLSAAYATRYQILAFGRGEEDDRDAVSHAGALLPILALSAATLVLCLLWLPSVAARVGDWLGAELPAGTLAELLLSLVFVAGGIALGLLVARRAPAIGTAGWSAALADWLGLPTLLEKAVAQPAEGLARVLARLDDRVVDGGVRLAAGLAVGLARILARLDDRVVDRGVRLAAALSVWLARVGDRFGERVTDGLPSGTAFLVGLAGTDLRRLQTGLSHHYYVIVAAGLAAAVAILAFGA